jgi:hypothetical protein
MIPADRQLTFECCCENGERLGVQVCPKCQEWMNDFNRQFEEIQAVIHELPKTGHAPDNLSIAAYLREVATCIEEGEHGDIRTVIVIMEGFDGSIMRNTCGQPTDLCRVIGLLTLATNAAMVVEEVK